MSKHTRRPRPFITLRRGLIVGLSVAARGPVFSATMTMLYSRKIAQDTIAPDGTPLRFKPLRWHKTSQTADSVKP